MVNRLTILTNCARYASESYVKVTPREGPKFRSRFWGRHPQARIKRATECLIRNCQHMSMIQVIGVRALRKSAQSRTI